MDLIMNAYVEKIAQRIVELLGLRNYFSRLIYFVNDSFQMDISRLTKSTQCIQEEMENNHNKLME